MAFDDKIELSVLGLSASPGSSNAYALILKEVEGDRRLPIIIGAFEAQAIALELEGVAPPRPMTHDLMRNIIDELGASLSEVFINEIREGTFYARLMFDSHGIEIDARPSDAIALAVRFGSPIFIRGEILEETGLLPQGDEEEEGEGSFDSTNPPGTDEPAEEESKASTPATKLERLNVQLEKAIKNEDYELAANIRDEIKRILESS